ncbi:MAG TPA: hypothetical protein VGV38_21935, partial [Pyrinomonadaceae bacterium]|nr:hypothetical protein [Pyrinomonadaceae bacterium]
LWPGARYTTSDRRRAIERGLRFLQRFARDPDNFEAFGDDLTWWFGASADSFKDPAHARAARRFGLECARRWRASHPVLPARADADTVVTYLSGDQAANTFGLRDPALNEQIRLAAARFTARDFLKFDPLSEPPPSDLPDKCDRCRATTNARGAKVCRVCKHGLKMRSRYDVWCEALINTYVGERGGVTLGARYRDVLRWLPSMRPYPSGRPHDPDFYDAVYAVTHVVYTLNDYTAFRLSPRLLPDEFAFLKANLRHAIALKDGDMLGEFMDSLKAFGLTLDDPDLRAGTAYLLARQNPDGSWGDVKEKDLYLRYHAVMTAINGLADYSLRREGPNPPELRPLLEEWAGAR